MLWEAIPTALVAAFAPSTLLIVAGLLNLKRPVRNASVFLASAAVVTLAVGFAAVELLSGTSIDNSHKHPTAPPVLDLVVGLAILVAAAFVARRPPHEPKEKAEPRDMRLLVIVGLGLFVGTPSPLYLASLHSIAKGNPSGAAAVVDVLVIAAIVLFMAELPLVLYLFAPQRTAAILKASNAWLARNGRVIALSAAGIVGCYFVVSGIVHLL
jgi:hypothetical protein